MQLIKILSFSLLILSLVSCGGGSGSNEDNSGDNQAEQSRPFKLKVRTSNPGTSTDLQFEIPTIGQGYLYSVDCDSDGFVEVEGATDNFTCDYGVAGDYTISISGDFPRIYFNDAKDTKKAIDIEQWGTIEWHSMKNAFRGAINLDSSAVDMPDLSAVTDMSAMFRGAEIFNGDVSNWDVSHITNMIDTFSDMKLFNGDVSSWDVSNVTKMRWMFLFSESFNQDIGGWTVSKVTDFEGMFNGATEFNQDIGDWNTSKAKFMQNMFINTVAFNQDISDWDVSHVTNMLGMFFRATAFDQNLGPWQVINVKNMKGMFGQISLSTQNYDSLLNSWSQQILERDVEFSGGNSKYSPAGAAARQSLIDTYNWTIVDGGAE